MVGSKSLSVRRAIVLGWECLCNNFLIFLMSGGVLYLTHVVNSNWPSMSLMGLVGTVGGFLVNIMLMRAALVASRGNKLSLADLRVPIGVILHLFMGFLIMGFIIFFVPAILGYLYWSIALRVSGQLLPHSLYLIVVVFPALILELFIIARLALVPYLVLDQNMDIFSGIKQSFLLIRNVTFKVMGLLLLIFGISILIIYGRGFMLVPLYRMGVSNLILNILYIGIAVLGYVVSYPISYGALASAYDQLQGQE